MPEPTVGELPQAKFVTVAETPIYVTKPDGVVATVTLKGAAKRNPDDPVILMRQKSRRAGEDEYLKPLDNLNDLEQVDWDKVGGLKYTDAEGEHLITKDNLSLTPPEPQLEPAAVPPGEPRRVLETVAGVPTLTIVGLRAYETRAYDLAAKSMQLKPKEMANIFERLLEIKRSIWKHSLGHTYFQEKARQYYLDMLESANSPFAAESIKAAEATGQKRYDELLKNSNFLSRAGTRFVDYLRSNLGMRTMVQRFALEEIGHMREQGQIKEAASFERESTATRKRFEQDFDRQDNFIRKTLGEKLELADEPLAAEIRGLVRRYATGEIASKEAFDGETKKLYESLKSARPDVFAKAELYSSSLYDVAETLRTRASHDAGLASIDSELASMQVRLGLGQMGEATQLEPTAVKKGTEAVQKTISWLTKRDILFNEVTVSSGVALALSLASFPARTFASTQARLLASGAGGFAVGALWGGVREYQQLNREYLTHMREREAGLTFSPDAKRRAWMERFYLSQRSSDQLIASLGSEDLQTKLATLADAKARKTLSSREKQRYGLIQFSGLENIETQRTNLDLAVDRAELQIEDKQFLDELTKAQTRVLTEGVEALEGLDDPVKTTLGLLSKYNPEVEIMRRRFPLLGPEYKTGEKATGMEEILKEFRRAALGASVRKGLVVGLSGAVIGAGVREGLQLGFEGANRLGLHLFTVTHNLRVEEGNLNVIDADGNARTVVTDLDSHLKYKDGVFTDATKQYIRDQGERLGLKFEFPDPTHSAVEFSGATHPLPDIGDESITAPTELHWVYKPEEGIRQLVVDAKDETAHVLYSDIGGPHEPSAGLSAIRNSELFSFTAEQSKDVAASRFDLPTILSIPHSGGTYDFFATIPTGTELHQTAPGLYELARGDETLLSGIKIDEFGRITNIPSLEDAAAEHGLVLDNSAATILTREGGVNLDPFDKVVGTMGEEKGFHGPWGWLEDPINASSDIEHHLPATNLAKNLFRGTYENYYHAADEVDGTFKWDIDGVKVNYNAMQADTTFHNVPGAIFRDHQLVELAKIMDEAIRIKEVDGGSLTELQQAAYDIGRVGRVATAREVDMFIEALGGETKEETIRVFTPIIEQTITEPAHIEGINSEIVTNVISLAETPVVPEIPWIPLPLVGRRPLEPYEPLVPYAPPEVPPGAIFPLLPRPEDEHPTPFLYTPAYGALIAPQETEKGGLYPKEAKYTEEEILAFYASRMNPDLKDNPKTKLDFDKTTSWYLDRQKPEYRQALESLNDSIGAPMSGTAEMAICIPVAAHHEGKNIYGTLEQYTSQKDLDGNPLDPKKYEIILFLNAPAQATRDATHEEVKRFVSDHPDMPIRIATATFPNGSVRYGAYIKYAYDLALLRALKRQNPVQKDILIATGDADLVSIDPTYVASNMAFMHSPQGANLDAGLAAQDLDHRVLEAYPTFKAALRFSQYQEAQSRKGIPGVVNPNIQTQGRTTIIRGSTLAGIGGVNSSSPAGADIELGHMLNFARHGKKWDIPFDQKTIDYNNKTFIETSARRELATYLSGKTLTQTWTKFDEGENVRGKTAEELVAMSTERPGQINAKELERQINAFREWQVPMDSPFTKQALEWMGLKEGVDYIVEDDSVEASRGNQWKKRIRFTSDLPGLQKRIDTLPNEPQAIVA